MNCIDVSRLLEQYIMNELDKDTAEKIETHLHECSECNKEYTEFRQVISALRNLHNIVTVKEDVLIMAKKNISRNTNTRKRKNNAFSVIAACICLAVCVFTSSLLVFPSFAYKYVPDLPVVKEMAEVRNQSEEIRQQNEKIARENEEIKRENQEIKQQMESIILENEQLRMKLKEIGGEEITEITTSEGVPETDNIAIQSLVVDYLKAMYRGDLDTIKSLSTDGFNAQIDGMKDYILMESQGLVIFRTITNTAFHNNRYMVFVRVNDTNSEGEADYQWNFELLKINGKFLVDFVGMDA